MQILKEDQSGEEYVGQSFKLTREWNYVAPNGEVFLTMWVLTQDGHFIDYSQFRHDLASKYNLKLIGYDTI